MAIRYAVTDGNWSNTATWDGGTLPADTDDVYANNKTVNIDQSVTVNSLKKIAGTGITAGGQFVVTAEATVTITAGIVAADNVTNSTYLLGVDAGSANVGIVTPSITGGAGTGRFAIQVLATFSGHLALSAPTGSVEITSGSSSAYGLYNTGASATITVTGNITGGAAANSYCLYNTGASATITVTGNITGGTGSNAHGLYNGATSATITVTGSINGNSTGAYGLYNTGASATITVTGNITGGAAANSYCLYNTGASATITVTGNITGGTGSNAHGLYNTGNNTAVTARGDFYACDSADGGTYAIFMSNSGVGSLARLSGHAYSAGAIAGKGNNGYFPLTGQWCAIEGEDLVLHIRNDDGFPAALDGSPRILSVYGTNLPEASDVREGTLYGPEATVEGTLAVPPADAVAIGVPTDSTVGQAIVRAEELATITGSQIATVGGVPGGGGGGGATHATRSASTPSHSYVGTAPVDTLESTPSWSITRITLTSPPVVQHATGAWTERATLTYS